MAGTIDAQTPLERDREAAARAFIAAHGFEHIDDIAFIPDATEPLSSTAVHVRMPALQFTHFDSVNHRRARTEISAAGLTIPVQGRTMLPRRIDETQFGISMLEELANAPQPPMIDEWIQSTDHRPGN